MTELLSVQQLRTSFMTRGGEVQSVRGVSFDVREGEVIGIVGESGSGKSVTAKSLIGLIPPPGQIKSGEVWFRGENMLAMSDKELRRIRGNRIAMIFQDPMTSLNPVIKVGAQIIEVLQRHKKLGKAEARARAIELLRQVGIPSPETRIDQYPHEFSGGMRQRAMIAMALSCQPELLIADEPTTALDVTIQAQILGLMKQLRDTTRTAILLITHDLGVVAQVCTRVVVMYGGLIMEEGAVEDIFERPQHPYTQGLLRSIPKVTDGQRERLATIEGTPPNLLHPPEGCPFMERCAYATEQCRQMPPYVTTEPGHRSLCWLLDEQHQEGSNQKREEDAE
ncbi:ABC transporter ATP-binding protein [Paenibacillus apiarius]|uniref:ABC transporter ATP-binding protein n=1 Tax=Paenibacillus apiarius TaxID=46240 RepID=A0ABT4E0F8_9BACL|nr:ABC transporter ATP-binding protein [Paenibacillus apiarius]MCY9512742.1 ABC transporter ATP-binding protein [Paenibacillus apiarius]MCY9523082.1 ABC transporter ATP-binding protein [Paenibacillus apiarius]MCY9555205.1 ABC transporter ATP-binding protein [Paenibacillus apiarius]MCY9556480.1 ABC transporter ATP-binding protein [Paenibacillus apiarius]MCY9682983.1 ABC transporter ATP-binding protein [Paenibacillus apiarius]